MINLPVFTHTLRRRRISMLWWSIGLAALTALIAIAYPTIRDNTALDKTIANLPPGVEAALGLDPSTLISSPIGYLNSQYFSNIFPAALLIFAVGLAAWSISGDESAGTLELLLANPVSRTRVALERALALFILLTVLTAVSCIVLLFIATPVTFIPTVSTADICAASISAMLIALTFGALAFAIGAGTGSRGLAIGISAAYAVTGFVIQGLGEAVKPLSTARLFSPWHWLIDGNPVKYGFSAEAFIVPIAVSVLLVGIGVGLLNRRDIG